MKNCVRVSEELNIEFIKEYVILISKFKAIPLIRKTVIPAALEKYESLTISRQIKLL